MVEVFQYEIDDDNGGFVECAIDSGGWDDSSIETGWRLQWGWLYRLSTIAFDGQVNTCGGSLR